MPTSVKITGTATEIHSNTTSVFDLDTAELVEGEKILNDGVMKGRLWQCFFDGIRISHSNLRYQGREIAEWKGNLDVISMGFNLDGTVVLRRGDTEKFKIGKNEHNVFYTADEELTMSNLDTVSEMVIIQFSVDTFLRLTESTFDSLARFRDEVLKNRMVTLAAHNDTLDWEMQGVIQAILNNSYTGGLRKMYLFSKCIELLVLQAKRFETDSAVSYVFCKTKSDRDRVTYARDYLIENAAQPPTLSKLANMAGINEFKLKNGFKELFNKTAFQYLTEFRMNQARAELSKKEKTVSEIAYELGFSSPQHFSKAYKKMFGIAPGREK